MRFGSPEYFWYLLLLPFLVGFFMFAWQRRQAALRRFAQLDMVKRLTSSGTLTRQIWKWVLFSLALVFLIFALVRPRFGVQMEMVERRGVDIIVALDISKSMLARDITPNRIDRAKHEIDKFISLLKGDRIGIVIFAGESYVQCPLTLDYGAAKLFLHAVEPDWIQVQGTALSEAINQASEAFRHKARKHKVLIVISDGEDHEGEAEAAAEQAAKEGARIYTIGLGSESGVPIPVSQGANNVIYKKDRAGNLVMTRLNPVTLEKIALEGNGRYFHAGTNLDLPAIYAEIARMEKRNLGKNKIAVYEERYQLPLLIALLLLIGEFFIPERTKPKKKWTGRFS